MLHDRCDQPGRQRTGTYTVTYAFGNGSCANTTTTTVSVVTGPTATISYAGGPFCYQRQRVCNRQSGNGGHTATQRAWHQQRRVPSTLAASAGPM